VKIGRNLLVRHKTTFLKKRIYVEVSSKLWEKMTAKGGRGARDDSQRSGHVSCSGDELRSGG